MADVGAQPATSASKPAARPAPVMWSAEQVLAMAPDPAARRAAQGVAGDKSWAETGRTGPGDDLPQMVWGLAVGSGVHPYQAAVDVTGPAYRCSCPSRKFPCKHAVGLLLRWSSGAVPEAPAPGWVRQWHAERSERAARAASQGRPNRPGPETETATAREPGTATHADVGRSQARRAERVAAGLDELDRWLADQVRTGIAGLAKAGYEPWDTMAARLVDAQAGTVAGVVRRLAPLAGTPDRLLTELALLRLLVEGFRRIEELPEDLAATVRTRAGLPMPAERVLAGPGVRDLWQVLGLRDEQEDQLTVRRIWLRGERTGRAALVLSFAAPGQVLSSDLMLGTRLDADLCFYPNATPLRALVATRHAAAEPLPGPSAAVEPLPGPSVPAAAGSIGDALREYAVALAGDPWLERWPVALAGVQPVRLDRQWYLVEPDGTGLPLDPAAGEPWVLLAAAAGRPVALLGEWSAAGLRPLTAWADGRLVRL